MPGERGDSDACRDGEELDARLTAAQRQQFDAAKKAVQAQQYAEGLAGFKVLLQDLPGDSLLTKYASDAALQMGDSAYALGVLKPLVMENFEDWQAVAMLARAAAESGDGHTRDAAMMNMAMLRQHGFYPAEYDAVCPGADKGWRKRDDDPMLSCAMGGL